MKNIDKLKHMRDTKEKWEEIEYNLLEKKEINWVGTYWTLCGYCKINIKFNNTSKCKNCSLSKTFVNGLPVCEGYRSISTSWAYKTLELADKRNFSKALKCCRIVLGKIRKDIDDIFKKRIKVLKIKSNLIFISACAVPVIAVAMTAIGLVLLWKYV